MAAAAEDASVAGPPETVTKAEATAEDDDVDWRKLLDVTWNKLEKRRPSSSKRPLSSQKTEGDSCAKSSSSQPVQRTGLGSWSRLLSRAPVPEDAHPEQTEIPAVSSEASALEVAAEEAGDDDMEVDLGTFLNSCWKKVSPSAVAHQAASVVAAEAEGGAELSGEGILDANTGHRQDVHDVDEDEDALEETDAHCLDSREVEESDLLVDEEEDVGEEVGEAHIEEAPGSDVLTIEINDDDDDNDNERAEVEAPSLMKTKTVAKAKSAKPPSGPPPKHLQAGWKGPVVGPAKAGAFKAQGGSASSGASGGAKRKFWMQARVPGIQPNVDRFGRSIRWVNGCPVRTGTPIQPLQKAAFSPQPAGFVRPSTFAHPASSSQRIPKFGGPVQPTRTDTFSSARKIPKASGIVQPTRTNSFSSVQKIPKARGFVQPTCPGTFSVQQRIPKSGGLVQPTRTNSVSTAQRIPKAGGPAQAKPQLSKQMVRPQRNGNQASGSQLATNIRGGKFERAMSGNTPNACKRPRTDTGAIAALDAEGRPYNLNTVVVNFANVGASYAKKVLKRQPGEHPGLFDWEGVRRCVTYLTKNLGVKVIGVIFENFWATNNNSREKQEIPADIRSFCESIEETPRIVGRNHSSADDEMTIKCAYHRNCRFMDNDNYRDWKQQLRDERCRAWLDRCQDLLHMRYYFDSSIGVFETLDGNVPPGLLAPNGENIPGVVSKRALWSLPNR